MLIQNKTIWTPDNSFLLEYKERCECGEFIIGNDLRTQLNNLCEDLHNDDFFYDTTDALMRMDFMENCVRLTKSPYYNKPMVLMLWQKAFIETVYSFKMAKLTAERNMIIDRFKKILLLIARKNTKSETCSGIGLSEFVVGNEGADIVASSNDDAQASIVYDAIDLMRQLIDPNDKDTKRNQRFILNKATNTKIFKLSDRTNNKEGRNIDFAIVDEVHEMQENVIVKSIEQSQSIKDNPKLFLITTEGFVVDGYLDDEIKTGRKIIYGEGDGTQAEQRRLDWWYTQDSEQEVFTNPQSWHKSNPALIYGIKKKDYLEEQVDSARKSKADRIFVLSKDFNIKQNGAQSWLELQDYTYNAVYNIEDMRGAYCLGMVDLAETTDLCCAKVLMMKPNDSTKYIYTQYFLPQSKLEVDKDDHNAGAKYKEWVDAGYITICEGNEIDLAAVADWFYQLYLDYDIRLYKCGYDQRFSKDWLNRMSDYGWTKEGQDVEMILQNAPTLNNALKLVEADLKARYINYNENPVDRWCFKNACLKVNDQRQALCIKTNNENKIDGSVTIIGLYEMYRRYKSDFIKMVGD